MRITSPAFGSNQSIPTKYTCDGENINPPLIFEAIPKEAVSLALIMEDPDAPVGLWVHWVVFNIDPNISAIKENSIPKGSVVGQNTRQGNHYAGPCPPDREHRYFFKLYALDVKLNLPPSANKDQLVAAIDDHVIEKAELVGLYNRSNPSN